MPSGEKGAKAKGAQHGPAGDRDIPQGQAMSRPNQEQLQLHLRLQAHHKAAHTRMQRDDGRLLGRPRQQPVTTGVATAQRGASGPPVVTGMPGRKLQQKEASAGTWAAVRPHRAELLAQPFLIHHGPKRPAPAPPVAMGSARQLGQPVLSQHGPKRPAPAPPAAMGGGGGQVRQTHSAQAAAAARLPSSAEQGSQNSMHALSQPSAAAHVQLAFAPTFNKDVLKAPAAGLSGSQQQDDSIVARAPSSAPAVHGQASRDHHAPAAAAQQPASQLAAGQPSSAAAPAVEAVERSSSGQPKAKSASKSPRQRATAGVGERASTRVLHQMLGISGSPTERASMRLVMKRKRSLSPEYSVSAQACHAPSLPARVGSAKRPAPLAPGVTPSGVSSPDEQVFGPSRMPRGIGPKLDYHRPPQHKSAPAPAAPAAAAAPASRPVGRPPKSRSPEHRSTPATALPAPPPRPMGRPPKNAVAKQKKVALRPLGPESRGGTALLSPRKKRIMDWRDAQPSAVLPAGFRQAVSQTHRPGSVTEAAAAVKPTHAASAPACQQAQRSMPAQASQAVGTRKQAPYRPGQPKGKSLAALALAADTLVEPGQIGVRMPGDPPSPEELLKGPKSVASSAPCAQYREPISLEDVVEKHQRQPHTSSAAAVYCTQLREAKEVSEASRRKQQQQLQRLKQQLHVPATQNPRDALRKQAMPKRMQRGDGMPDSPASDAANADIPGTMTEGEAGPAISKRGRQLRQVLRVDYPLPNTGLMYKGTGVTRGEKWWNRPGSAVASPKQAVTLQQSHAVPPASKGSPPAQGRAGAPQSTVQQSAVSSGQATVPHVPGKGRVKLKASRLPSRLPSPRGVAVPIEAALQGEAVPQEAAKLGLPEDLALTLMQACLPLTAAVQPKPDMPPPSPDSLRGMPFTVDNRWSWSLDQPSAWEWRAKHHIEEAQHLRTPIPPAKVHPSNTAAPDQAATLAAVDSRQLPKSAPAAVGRVSQQDADRRGGLLEDSTGSALPSPDQLGRQAAQLPRGCLTERNVRSVEAGKLLPPRPPKAAKRLKFSELAGDLAETPSQACTSAITALAQQLARPACQAGLPVQLQLQSKKPVGSPTVPHDSAIPQAAGSDAKAEAAGSPLPAQAQSGRQPGAELSSPQTGRHRQHADRASQADINQAAGSKGQSSSPPAAAYGVGPAGSLAGASEGTRTPARRGRPVGSRSHGTRGTPSPRKESLRPRREPIVQGFPLSYAMAIAITQARELAGGRRPYIARRFRCLALRCAHALHMRHDEDEAPDWAAAHQPSCVDLKPTAIFPRPDCSTAARHGASPQVAAPVHRLAAPTEEGIVDASQLPSGDCHDERGVKVEMLDTDLTAVPGQPVLASCSPVKARTSRGQKVNYNLKQLMKKAWKKPQDYSTSTRVPASAAYPLEDDCTDVLLRVQHPSAEPAPDFSMSAFCATAASAAHGPLPRGRRKQPPSNPEAHRLFSLKLEFISVGIASRSFGASAAEQGYSTIQDAALYVGFSGHQAGAIRPGLSSRQKASENGAAASAVSASSAERHRKAEGQRLAKLCAKQTSAAPEASTAPASGLAGISAACSDPGASETGEGQRLVRQCPEMTSGAPLPQAPARSLSRAVARVSAAPDASRAAASVLAGASAARPSHAASGFARRAPDSQPAGLSRPSVQLRGALPVPAKALPVPTAACTGFQAAFLSQGVPRTAAASVPQKGLLPPPVYTPFQQQALAASVQAMMTPRSSGAATGSPHVMARLRAAMQLATAEAQAATSAAPAATACVLAHSQAPSARVRAISQGLQVSAAAAAKASHIASAAMHCASAGLLAGTPVGMGLACGLRPHPAQGAPHEASAPDSLAPGAALLPSSPAGVDAAKVLQLTQVMAPGVAKALPQARPASGPHAAGAHGGSPVLDQATLRRLAKELVEPVLKVLTPPGPHGLAAAVASCLPEASRRQAPAAVPRQAPRHEAPPVFAQGPRQPPGLVTDNGADPAQSSPAGAAAEGLPPAKRRRVRVKVVLAAGEVTPGGPSALLSPLPCMQSGVPPETAHGSAKAMRWSSRAAASRDSGRFRADAPGPRRPQMQAVHARSPPGLPNGRPRTATQDNNEQPRLHLEGRTCQPSAKQNADAAVAYICQLRRDLPPDAYEAMVNILHHFRRHSLDILAVVDQVVEILCHPGRHHLMAGFEQYLDRPALARFRAKYGAFLLLDAASQEGIPTQQQQQVVQDCRTAWPQDTVVDLTAERD